MATQLEIQNLERFVKNEGGIYSQETVNRAKAELAKIQQNLSAAINPGANTASKVGWYDLNSNHFDDVYPDLNLSSTQASRTSTNATVVQNPAGEAAPTSRGQATPMNQRASALPKSTSAGTNANVTSAVNTSSANANASQVHVNTEPRKFDPNFSEEFVGETKNRKIHSNVVREQNAGWKPTAPGVHPEINPNNLPAPIQKGETGVAVIAEKVDNAADDAGKAVKKSKGLLAKVGKFFSQHGKKILKGGAIVAALGLAALLLSKCAGDKKDNVAEQPTTPVVVPPVDEEPIAETPVEETPVVVAPPAKDEEQPVKDEEPTTPATTEWTVKKGDNVWNIAKEVLEEKLDRTPTLQEIKKAEQQIMKDNGLEFESDNYTCIIQPGQKLTINL